MKTFQEFISESNRLRAITLGPSRSPVGRQRQQRDNSERAAFRRAGVRRTRKSEKGDRVRFKAIPREYTSTAITSYPHQSSFAIQNMPDKVNDRSGRVTSTKDRALYIRRLMRQTGERSDRKVHAVDILPRKDFKKNDPTEMITRGKEYHGAVKKIPTDIEGKPGEVFMGKAVEVMPGSKNIMKGRKKREELYTRLLGASDRDPITNLQSARIKSN